MRVGFGFYTVTFRPSRVFHFRVFSRPSVDTDEQSSCKFPAFLPNIQNVVTNRLLRADNVFVSFYFAIL